MRIKKTLQLIFVLSIVITFSLLSNNHAGATTASTRQNTDINFLLDQYLNQSETNYIVNGVSGSTLYSKFDQINTNPLLADWDMKTYTYTQPASTSRNTGGNYPASSIPYSSGNYSGTLSLYNVTNAPYTVDQGHYTTDTKFVSCCSFSGGGFVPQGGAGTPCGSNCNSVSYNSGGYTGSLGVCGYSYSSTNLYNPAYYGYNWSRSGHHCGNVSKTYWVPNLVSYNNYTGYYSGTLYYYYRQPYNPNWTRAQSYRYIVYISDNTVSQLTDLQKAQSDANSKIILVGNQAIKSQIGYTCFIENNKPIDQIVDDISKCISDQNQLFTFSTDAKSENPLYGLTGIPAGESIRAYNTVSVDQYSNYLTYGIYNGSGSLVVSLVTVPYYSGTLNGSTVSWNDLLYSIPSTLVDGSYTFKVVDTETDGQNIPISFPITVSTPIGLVPNMPSQVVVNYNQTVGATTSIYATSVNLVLYNGTPYQKNVAMTNTSTSGGVKYWSYSYVAPNVPDGTYTAQFTATTANGKTQVVNVTYTSTHNTPPVAVFDWTPHTIYEGDTVSLINQSYDNEGDPMSFVWTITDPSGVTSTQSVPLGGSPNGATIGRVKAGTYTVTLKATDSHGASDSTSTVTHTFNVIALSVTGSVSHTPDWKSFMITNFPSRSSNNFWAGERFVLGATTTNITVAPDLCETVTVGMSYTGDSVGLIPDGVHQNWSEEMWGDTYDSLPNANEPYTFIFTAVFRNNNGLTTTKTNITTVYLNGTVFDVIKTQEVR